MVYIIQNPGREIFRGFAVSGKKMEQGKGAQHAEQKV